MRKFWRTVLNTIGVLAIVTAVFLAVFMLMDQKLEGFDGSNGFQEIKNYYSQKTGELIVGEPVVVEGISYNKYAYQQLDEEAQKTYDQILDCILNFKEDVPISTKDEEVLAQAYEAVMADYGNLFWIKGYQFNTYTSGSSVLGLDFTPKYTMDQEQRDIYQAVIDAKAKDWLSGISKNDTDYDKAKYVFELLINNVDYNTDSLENQNILSVFLYQSTVCQGYADAAWYLLDQLGIKSTIITGQANGESHAWNLVYLDNAYYYMDVTWGNSKYMDLDNSTAKRVNYAYLAMTTEEIGQTHTITSTFPVPECLSTADNYYYHNGLYFENFAIDAIGKLLKESYQRGDSEISMKFANADLYNQVIEYFFNDQHIADYCKGLSSVYYLMDESANVLTITW
ncbi:MAG: hypothetical protein K5773_05195 [Pseudobutyrivibrio sp.]|nr:hypothetical protein [Pseudobutyrivibrio sp.]